MAEMLGIASEASQENREELDRSWADLPMEILSEISSHLFGGDQIIFRLVCKSWQSVTANIRPLPPPIGSTLSKSPCLFFLNNQFFHPIYNDTYYIDIPEISYAIIRFSKYGWLLMTQGGETIFFFNPFTKVRIELPPIPIPSGFTSLCFSSPPTSSDCVVFGVTSQDEEEIAISYIKRGETNWTTHQEIKNKRHFQSSCCSPILYKGRYYCMGLEGNLFVYDPSKNKPNWTASPKPLRKRLRASHCMYFMVENDGELLAVFMSHDGTWICVTRLNLSKMAWENVQNLGDKMLFVSHPACFSETAFVRGTANKIYLTRFNGKDGLFYSLTTRKFHTFAGGDISGESFYDFELQPHCTWIKPTYETITCDQVFDW